jgi:hypothetical protein
MERHARIDSQVGAGGTVLVVVVVPVSVSGCREKCAVNHPFGGSEAVTVFQV